MLVVGSLLCSSLVWGFSLLCLYLVRLRCGFVDYCLLVIACCSFVILLAEIAVCRL